MRKIPRSIALFLLCILTIASLLIPASGSEIPQETATKGPGLYFGTLHGHSSLSEGTLDPESCYTAAADMDFFALTDHSDSFDQPANLSDGGNSLAWTTGKAAAAAATTSDFVGLFGFEMSWDNGLGHISTFCTPGFVSWRQEDFFAFRNGLQNFYAALSGIPDAIGQFNHPSKQQGDFRDFDFWTPEADRVMALLEVGSPDRPSAYSFYDQALAKGWHVAPVNNDPSGRTAIFAQSLTEEGLYDAIRSRRVYATEDVDLSIHYSMDGHQMGSRVKAWQLGEAADILVTLSDPTDAIGTVEVIGEQGASLAKQNCDGQWATVEFSLPTNQAYYYIKVYQPDGDIAVTSPVWVEQEEYAGIQGLAAKTDLPVQGQPLELELTLYNREGALFAPTQVDVFVDGILAQSLPVAEQLWQGSLTLPISLTLDTPGLRHISVTVTANLGDAPREYTAELTLSIRIPEMVTSILIDDTHGNTENYAQLSQLAMENNIAVRTETVEITANMLEKASILVLPGAETEYSPEFIHRVYTYAQYGGTILFTEGNEYSNQLLSSLGSTLRFEEDDGGIRYVTDFVGTSPWCENLLPGQLYMCSGSVTALPESRIVEGVLAAEGKIFAGSGAWLSDAALAEPKNLWDPPNANIAIVKNILGHSEVVLPLTPIADLRVAEVGQLHRVRGYVTANTFGDTLYIQDDTGGIAVTNYTGETLSLGTAVEIQGILSQPDKNPVLEVISCKFPEVSLYRYLPMEGNFSQLMNNALHGGDLVQVEGKVASFRTDKTGAVREVVLEKDGQFALVYIDEGIVSNSRGYNDLAERVEVGRNFRAIGLVHMREDGVSVVRVRNCDEVVYVPVIRYYWEPAAADNPRVGDDVGIWTLCALFCAVAIPFFRKKRIM